MNLKYGHIPVLHCECTTSQNKRDLAELRCPDETPSHVTQVGSMSLRGERERKKEKSGSSRETWKRMGEGGVNTLPAL